MVYEILFGFLSTTLQILKIGSIKHTNHILTLRSLQFLFPFPGILFPRILHGSFSHFKSLFKYYFICEVFSNTLVLNSNPLPLPTQEFPMLEACSTFKVLSKSNFYSKNFLSIYSWIFCFLNCVY